MLYSLNDRWKHLTHLHPPIRMHTFIQSSYVPCFSCRTSFSHCHNSKGNLGFSVLPKDSSEFRPPNILDSGQHTRPPEPQPSLYVVRNPTQCSSSKQGRTLSCTYLHTPFRCVITGLSHLSSRFCFSHPSFKNSNSYNFIWLMHLHFHQKRHNSINRSLHRSKCLTAVMSWLHFKQSTWNIYSSTVKLTISRSC